MDLPSPRAPNAETKKVLKPPRTSFYLIRFGRCSRKGNRTACPLHSFTAAIKATVSRKKNEIMADQIVPRFVSAGPPPKKKKTLPMEVSI